MSGRVWIFIIEAQMKRFVMLLALLSFVTALDSAKPQQSEAVSERARKIHFSSIVLDTHIDTTPKLQTSWKFTEEHKEGAIDLPRMKRGGLNALFFSIFM